jgi:hypothetical protein
VRQRSRGDTRDGIGQSRSATLRYHQAGGTGGESRADDGADVVRVFNSIEKNKQAAIPGRGKQVFDFERCARSRKRHDALMMFRADRAVELRAIFESHWNVPGTGQFEKFLDAVAMEPASHKDAIQRVARCQGFFNGMESCQAICLKIAWAAIREIAAHQSSAAQNSIIR